MPNIANRIKAGLTQVFRNNASDPPATTVNASPAPRDFIEQRMLDTLLRASPDEQEELHELAATRSVADLTSILQGRYPNYANYFTDTRVAHVMAAYQAQMAPPPSAPPSQEEPMTVPAITIDRMITPHGRSFSDLTAEELSARRRAILAGTPFTLPVHRLFMNAVKETWRVLGPVAFVFFTVWEVYYFMNHFLVTANVFDVVLLWGISLIIEIPFMIATYDQSERRERAAERRARGEDDRMPGTGSSLAFWCILALVNVAGQIAFLSFVTRAGSSLSSPSAVGLWGFIILRVTGVIVGDCYTAFHLLPTEASIDRVLRGQKAQMDGEKRLADSDAERLHKDAETQQSLSRIQISVQRDKREAAFMEEWQRLNIAQALERQHHFIALERRQLRELTSGTSEDKETGGL